MKKLLLLCANFVFFSHGQANQTDILSDLAQQGQITPQEYNDYQNKIKNFTDLCNEKAYKGTSTFTSAEIDAFWNLVDELVAKN
ncbi:hypothetical protein [Candidatus Odyssella acanthamoebae]|uniref:Uncharacterized protein n=1 Tax=Candidatus Odyssella acanthamoebae TaxID=91604 RepID=A0A077AVI8_9PROT|nr:hypothetical protein [Candidatus Paracaedibacter acanthamoebae]AIK96054.1 hypothetical protein ID47_03785 [Candidatus Paracaedibacter acanthamoebae]